MKRTSAIVLLAGLVWFAEAKAQNQPPPPSGPPPAATGQTMYFSGGPSAAQVYSPGSASIPPEYRTGKYIHLEAALVALLNAQRELNVANGVDKAEYLPRALLGTQLAIDDVKRGMDTAAGRPTPAVSALPSLPTGVGNASSGLTIVPTATPTIPSPHMDAAIAGLTTAQNELKLASPSNKGIFLPRAVADVAFTIDNANAAINLTNSLPAAQPKPPPGLVPATPSPFVNDPRVLWGGLMVLLVVIAIIVEQAIRRRQRA